MRVLYVGDLQAASTALHRMKGLEALGLTIIPFDTYRYQAAGSRIARSLRHRLSLGANVSGLNRDLLIRAAAEKQLDWVWIDKGVWVRGETLSSLTGSGPRLLHFAGDPMILFHRTRHFVESIPLYDLHITTKGYEVERYRALGAKQVKVLLHGYDADFYRPRKLRRDELARYASDIAFVGHYEQHYHHRIAAAAETGADVAVWGRWQRAALRHPQLRHLVRGSGVWGEDYVTVLNATKIGLGLLTRYAPDSSTTRSLEIPACGTFLLAERSEEHAELFKEGREAEFFAGDGEMREKIDWYLKHDADRERIAAAGRERCLRSGYSYLERMRSAVAMMK